MSSKNEQLKKIIEVMVQKEVQRCLPHMIKEVMSNMIMESKITVPSRQTNTTQSLVNGNSHKRRALQEASGYAEDYEEYPTMNSSPRNRQAMAEMMGYGDIGRIGGGGGDNFITVTQGIPAHDGATFGPPVNQDDIPDHLIAAFNRDYSGMFKK